MRDALFMVLSLVGAFWLMATPLPDTIYWFRPQWVFLVVTYWLIARRNLLGPFSVSVIGLLTDSVMGTALGLHAIAMLLATYPLMIWQNRILRYAILPQLIVVLFVALFYQVATYCLHGFIGFAPMTLIGWIAPLETILLWPMAYLMLNTRTNAPSGV